MSRRSLLTVLLLAALASGARAEDPPAEPQTIEEAVFVEMDAQREAHDDVARELPWLPEGPTREAERLIEEIARRPVGVRATAWRFDHLPAALEGLAHGSSALLGADEAAGVSRHARTGDLVLLHAVYAEGPIGSMLLARDLERRQALLGRDIESAIGAVVSWPRVEGLRGGLRLQARLGLTAAEGLTLRYQISLAGAPHLETRPSLGGQLDAVSVPALLAAGTVRLRAGETAAIVRVEPDGSGRLVLLSLTGDRPDIPTVTDLGDGVVAVLAGHLESVEARPVARISGVHGRSEYAKDWEPRPDAWDAFAEAAGVADGDWQQAALGLRLGRASPRARRTLEALLTAGASVRGTRSRIDVARQGWGRLSLPASPGTAFRFFSGSVGTARVGTQVQSGCQSCVQAAPWTEPAGRGLEGAGWACVDGTVDLDLVGREVLEVVHKTFELRRIENGYLGYARDPFEVPLMRTRTLALRGALPSGADQLPGGARLRFHFDASAAAIGRTPVHDYVRRTPGAIPVGGGGSLLPGSTTTAPWAPIPLVVAGEPFSVRPGDESWIELLTWHPGVRRWESDGWCGMRVRYPVPDGTGETGYGIREGISIALTARHEDGALLLDAEGAIRGAPEDLGVFDPGDGPVRLVRSPGLLVDLRALPLGRGGRLAHGAGLELVIERPDADAAAGPRLEVEARTEGAVVAGFVTGRGAGGALDAGTDTLLPSDFASYSSSHQMGQLGTAFRTRSDGIGLYVEAKNRHARVDVALRTRPSRRRFDLRVDVEPDRPETQLALIGLRRRVTRRVLFLGTEDQLDYRSPDPSPHLEVSARVVPAGGEK